MVEITFSNFQEGLSPIPLKLDSVCAWNFTHIIFNTNMTQPFVHILEKTKLGDEAVDQNKHL